MYFASAIVRGQISRHVQFDFQNRILISWLPRLPALMHIKLWYQKLTHLIALIMSDSFKQLKVILSLRYLNSEKEKHLNWQLERFTIAAA